VTIFLLIRHGENDMINRKILAGRSCGVHLNDHGRRQTALLSGYLAHLPLQAIYSSPLERTMQTAQPIGQRQGRTVQVLPAINEVDFGIWTGRSFAALADDPQWKAFNASRSETRIPSGEIFSEVQLRMIDALEALREVHGNCLVALVSHADPIRTVVAHFLGMPLDGILRFEISPASVSVVDLTHRHAPRVLCLNSNGQELPLNA